MEEEILKKSLLRERNEVNFCFIKSQAANYPVHILCRVMKVGKYAFYAWQTRPGKLITVQELCHCINDLSCCLKSVGIV